MSTPRAASLTSAPGSASDEWILTAHGEIDVATSPELRDALTSLISRGASRIVVDLRETSFIDSAGLGVLVGALKRLREERDGKIVLRGMQDNVQRVFDITGLASVFSVDAS